MAGDWIKIEHWTPDKPEVFQMADELGIDPDAVVGKLIRVWIWADQQTRDGNAPSVTRSLLDRVAGVVGFATALEQVRWLTVEDGSITFSNFDRHNLQSAKTRAQTSKRVKNCRSVKRECNAASVTKALPEKRREEKNNSLSLSPAMAKVWPKWVAHRIQKFKPLSDMESETQLMQLGRCARDDADAVAMVEYSISRGAVNLITNGDHRQESTTRRATSHRGGTSFEEGLLQPGEYQT